jgi:ubiquinone/menaquinone biosynthesis C-methylase UbiE
LKRGYQYNFSAQASAMFNSSGRERKAKTMLAVLADYFGDDLQGLSLLDAGGSTGIIDCFLADYFKTVTGIDIDEPAIKEAKTKFKKKNLEFRLGDATNIDYPDNSFNVVICSHIYEHVPDAEKMMSEIFRILTPGGICYFAASNRLRWNEPHYNLPLLSVVPRPLAHVYIRLAKKASYYHELHYFYWGLKKLAQNFILHDYTEKIIDDPVKYKAEYMVKPASFTTKMAKFLVAYFYWVIPSYIWLLEKPK